MRRMRPLLEPRTTVRTLGVATLLLASVGCAASSAEVSQAPGSSRLQASVSASAEATASPTPTPSPAPSEVSPSASAPSGRADIAEVVTTDLVVRSAPGVGPDSEIYAPSLSEPLLLHILDGPIAGDGYEWYRVIPFDELYAGDIPRELPGVGWVAASGKDGEAWIAPWTGTCPASTTEELMWRSHLLALACFGDRELTLEGELDGCWEEAPGLSPSWFATHCVLAPFDYQGQLPTGLGFYYQGDNPQLDPQAPVRVTGHYDDPAALTCADPASGMDQGPPELIVLNCRTTFVATEITPTSAP